ncbi:MAG: ABC transporter substrate-binding protein [Deltaproteobacteria bacterium]|nr:ABC transporter substrate-binding protein [Deltaproteobacteria bacterium]
MCKRTVVLVVAFVLAVFWASNAPAAEIAIVKSDYKKYNKVISKVITGFSVESKVPVVEYDMKKDPDRGKKIFEIIKSRRPSLVLAIGPAAAAMAKREITDIPVVFVMVPDHQKYSLSADNMTGVSLQLPYKVQLATLRTIAPKIQNVGVLYNPKWSREVFEKASQAATEMGLTLVPSKVDDPEDVPSAVGTFLGKVDAVWMIPDQTVATPAAMKALIKFTYDSRVPFFTPVTSAVKKGALASLSPDYTAIGQQAGRLANQIVLQKLAAKAIPVTEPEGISIAINLSTARRLGVECNMALDIFTVAATQGYPIKVYK